MNPLLRGITWAATFELAACLFGLAVWLAYWVAL